MKNKQKIENNKNLKQKSTNNINDFQLNSK